MRKILHAKIHRATVTDANVNYVGSVSIDQKIIRESGLVVYEEVHIVDITMVHVYILMLFLLKKEAELYKLMEQLHIL